MALESGYCSCSCRDCFEIAITSGGPALCNACKEAGCEDDGETDCAVPYEPEEETVTERQHHACCGERITMNELTSGQHVCSRVRQ